jgi:hypothetical protein
MFCVCCNKYFLPEEYGQILCIECDLEIRADSWKPVD